MYLALTPNRTRDLAHCLRVVRSYTSGPFTAADRQQARERMAKALQPRTDRPAPSLRLSEGGFVYLTTWSWFTDEPTIDGVWEATDSLLGDVDNEKLGERVPEGLIDSLRTLTAAWQTI